jgi:hypothetical protein
MQSRFLKSATTICAASAIVIGGFASAAYPHDMHDNGGRHNGRHHGYNPGPSAPVVVTNGLNNPRQLSLVDGKALLIAEAGSGGPTCAGTGEDEMCIGATGSVSGVLFPQYGTNRSHTELVTGFVSGAGPDGSFAVGSDGVSQRSLHSPIYVQETYAPPDALPAGIPGEQSGKLLKARPFGTPSIVADITAYETANDPDGHGFDSDPYAVLVRHHDVLVADAAGNDILRVDHHGNVSLFHVFPNVVNDITTAARGPAGSDFVPTSLALGPHGDIYVGGLVGEIPGAGQVVKLDGRTGAVEQTWEGFSGVTGVAVGPDCSLYVSQLFATEANPITPEVQGVVTKVTRDGVHHDVDVPFPAGIVVDGHGNVFVSAWSISSAAGQSNVPPGVNVDTSGQVWRLHY